METNMLSKKILLLFALLIMLSACGNGVGGSVIGGAEKCSYMAHEGFCEGKFNKVSGTYSKWFEHSNLPDSVMVEAVVSVEEGVLLVSIESPEGELTQVEANPSSQARLLGTARVEGSMDDKGFQVIFEAVGGSSTGVIYDIHYRTP
jgi:hypothetical protein